LVECSYKRADSVRRFNVGRVVVLNTPPAVLNTASTGAVGPPTGAVGPPAGEGGPSQQGQSEQALERRSEHEYLQAVRVMLMQTRGGGGGDSTSIECLFSITPLPQDVRTRSITKKSRAHAIFPPSEAGTETMNLHALVQTAATAILELSFDPLGIGAQGLTDIARRVIGCHSIRETRV